MTQIASGGDVVRVMGTLVALAAMAFVVGAGAGLIWKQPGLLLAHWTGGTEEVAWTDDTPSTALDASGDLAPAAGTSYETASAAATRPAAAPAPTAPGEAPVAKPAPAAERTPRASASKPPARVAAAEATPPVAAPPPSGLAVQVGAFAERGAADSLVSRLRKAGFPAYAVAPDGGAWRVRVGPFPDRAGAEKSAVRLQQEQKLPTWILLAEGR